MNPIIYTFPEIFGIQLVLRWYGVLVMTGALVGAWYAAQELKRHGEDEEHLWDAIILLLPIGILGARLWYVANATLGGDSRYMDNPGQILNIPAGGLHFYGGLLFGLLTLWWYARRHKLDMWLLLDALAPATLLGQAIARPANFINQELYGQPTTLPWGISIDASHRIKEYSDMSLFPETTRFHPAFAYEMIWNFFAVGLIYWFVRRFPDKAKPGTALALWLILAGIGRFIIEAFRPDQPRIPGTDVSFTRVVAAAMALIGLLMYLVRNKTIKLAFAQNWEEEYKIAPPRADREAEKKISVQEKRRQRRKRNN